MGTELQGISLTVFRTVLMSSHYIFTKLLQCDPDYFEAIIHMGSYCRFSGTELQNIFGVRLYSTPRPHLQGPGYCQFT